MAFGVDRISQLAAAFTVCVALVGCGGGSSSSIAKDNKDNKSTDDSKPKKPLETVSVPAEEYIKEWKTDKDAAKKKYADKMIELSSTVMSVAIDTNGDQPMVFLTVGKDPLKAEMIQCVFPLSDEKSVHLTKGQTVKIKGKIPEFGIIAALIDCEVVEAGKSTALEVTAADLAMELAVNREKFSEKYHDKAVIVKGKVADIKVEPKQSYRFILETPDKNVEVVVLCLCSISDKVRDQLAKVTKGQEIQASGEGEAYSFGPAKITVTRALLLK
jgi:hypothetical protein